MKQLIYLPLPWSPRNHPNPSSTPMPEWVGYAFIGLIILMIIIANWLSNKDWD